VCGAGQTACTSGEKVTCTKTDSDNQNCGSCGTACKALEACIKGMCQGGCPPNEIACTPEAGPPFCTNPSSDNKNCGSCKMECGQKQLCSNGMCASQCAMGQTPCAGDGGPPYCAFTDRDNANCGTCGNTCGLLEVCAGGMCGKTCLMNQTMCVPEGGVDIDAGSYAFCTDVKTDNQHCGACFSPCPFMKPLCANGACVSPG